MHHLNPKQQKFVQEYQKDLNATQAAIRAGYSKKTARQIGGRLLTNVDIGAAVKAGQKMAAERAQITVDSVIARIDAAANRFLSSGEAASEIRALELLGKHVGAFAENINLRGDLSNLSDEDIKRRIQEKLAAR